MQAQEAEKNKANQSQFAPEAKPVQAIPKACGFEAATRRQPTEKKGHLKKQSQFAGRQNDVIIFITKTYGFFRRLKTEKNKANQSQFQGSALLSRRQVRIFRKPA